jgi:hypothetical protein
MCNGRRCEIALASALLLLALMSGCGKDNPSNVPPKDNLPPIGEDRAAKTGKDTPGADSTTSIVYLQQNWNPSRSEEFYFTSQGSQILPYNWFLKLETASDQTLLSDDWNLSKFGLLLQKKSKLNPDGLPVGFVKDDVKPVAYLGLTCAACHTTQINYNNVGYRIDGGPSLSDVGGFLFAVADALKATRDNPDKLDRFAKALGMSSASDKAALTKELAIVIDRRDGYNTRNFPPDAPPGFARVDAFGAILNEVFHEAAKITPTTPNPVKANTEPANAPVSYPCLWDTPQHDLVQWNGVAKNEGLGALGRNVGEVLGVFGRFDVPDSQGITGYQSTTQVQNLRSLEEWITGLWSPLWPTAIKTIDPAKRDKGAALFAANCQKCHLDIKRDDPKRTVVAQMKAVQTDNLMSVNFTSRRGASGKLEGAFLKYLPDSLHPERFGADAGSDDMLSQVVIGTIVGSWKEAPKDELADIEFKRRKKSVTGQMMPAGDSGPAYKARPLNGVWATAPYLHNGSVPTLYDLLLAPDNRPKSFHVGSREFDPDKVGLKEVATGFLYKTHDDKGNPIPGNSNVGHTFGASLTSDDDRWALVEYLKSL